MQVVAYLEVTPDVMPAKIYVNETAQALRGLMEPFSQMHRQPYNSNCTDLLNRVMIAGALVLHRVHAEAALNRQFLRLGTEGATLIGFPFSSGRWQIHCLQCKKEPLHLKPVKLRSCSRRPSATQAGAAFCILCSTDYECSPFLQKGRLVAVGCAEVEYCASHSSCTLRL